MYKLVNSASIFSLRNIKCPVAIQKSKLNLNQTVGSCKWSLQMILLIIKWPSCNPYPINKEHQKAKGSLVKYSGGQQLDNSNVLWNFKKIHRKVVKSYFIFSLSLVHYGTIVHWSYSHRLETREHGPIFSHIVEEPCYAGIEFAVMNPRFFVFFHCPDPFAFLFCPFHCYVHDAGWFDRLLKNKWLSVSMELTSVF